MRYQSKDLNFTRSVIRLAAHIEIPVPDMIQDDRWCSNRYSFNEAPLEFFGILMQTCWDSRTPKSLNVDRMFSSEIIEVHSLSRYVVPLLSNQSELFKAHGLWLSTLQLTTVQDSERCHPRLWREERFRHSSIRCFAFLRFQNSVQDDNWFSSFCCWASFDSVFVWLRGIDSAFYGTYKNPKWPALLTFLFIQNNQSPVRQHREQFGHWTVNPTYKHFGLTLLNKPHTILTEQFPSPFLPFYNTKNTGSIVSTRCLLVRLICFINSLREVKRCHIQLVSIWTLAIV